MLQEVTDLNVLSPATSSRSRPVKYGVLVGSIRKIPLVKGEDLATWSVYANTNLSRPREVLWTGSSFVALGAKEGEGGDGVEIFVLPANGDDTTYFPWFTPDHKVTGHKSVDVAVAALVSGDAISVAIERKGTDDETYVAHGGAQGELTLEKCK